VSLFTKNKKRAVNSFIMHLVNNSCPDLECMREGPRLDGRVGRVVMAVVIPVEKRKLRVEESFRATTKDLSTSGVSLILDGPVGIDEAILGFRQEGEMNFVRARAKHLEPMGGGFYRLGFELIEMIHPGDYPQLQDIEI